MSYDIELIRRYRKHYLDGEVKDDYDTIESWTPTYNYRDMLVAAGIYNALVRPKLLHPDYYEGVPLNEITATANMVIRPLERGLADLLARPEHFKQFDSPNGWGTLEDLIRTLTDYIAHLKEYPNAEILTCGASMPKITEDGQPT